MHDLAKETSCHMPFCESLMERFEEADADGKGELDWSAINLNVRQRSGLPNITCGDK